MLEASEHLLRRQVITPLTMAPASRPAPSHAPHHAVAEQFGHRRLVAAGVEAVLQVMKRTDEPGVPVLVAHRTPRPRPPYPAAIKLTPATASTIPTACQW